MTGRRVGALRIACLLGLGVSASDCGGGSAPSSFTEGDLASGDAATHMAAGASTAAGDPIEAIRRHPAFRARLESPSPFVARAGRWVATGALQPNRWRPLGTAPAVELAPRARGGVRLALGEGSWIDVVPLDGDDPPAEVRDDAVVFRGLRAGVDSIHVVTDSRYEEIRRVELASPSRLHERWRIVRGPGVGGILARDGVIEVANARGEVRLRTEPVFAAYADGTFAPAGLTLEADVFELTIEATRPGSLLVDPSWVSTGAVLQSDHNRQGMMVALADGRVLLAGGNPGGGGVSSSAAEVFDPGTKTWTSVSPMNEARREAVSVRLNDGRVLVAGSGTGSTTAEIFDPVSLTWSLTAGHLNVGRLRAHNQGDLVVLASGKVLVAATRIDSGNGAEIFDPSSGSFAIVASSPQTYNGALQSDGTVLLTGRTAGQSYRFNPTGSTYTADAALQTWPGSLPGVNLLAVGTRVFLVEPANFYGYYDTAAHSVGAVKPVPIGYGLNGYGPFAGAGGTLLVGGDSIYDPATDGWTPVSGLPADNRLDYVAPITGGLLAVNVNSGATLLLQALANGTACSSAGQCISGKCVDGVCCDNACTAACQACNVAGKEGTCSLVTGAPHGSRTCAGTGACAGSCDGVTSICKLPTSSTECAPASCSLGTAKAPSYCNGAGSCTAGASSSCGNYSCSATACKASCSSPADCASGFTCSGTSCVAVTPDAGSETGTDSGGGDSAAGDSGVADTSVADTSVADTGLADTRVADTGLADTSVADTGVGDSMAADTSIADVLADSDAAPSDSATVDTGNDLDSAAPHDAGLDSAVADSAIGPDSSTPDAGTCTTPGESCGDGKSCTDDLQCVSGEPTKTGCACALAGDPTSPGGSWLGVGFAGAVGAGFGARLRRRRRP